MSNGAVGLWALVALRLRRLDLPALWWSTAVAYGLVFVEIVVGVVRLQTSGVEAPAFHVLYGVSAAFTIAVLHGYRRQLQARRLLVFGLGSLFIMGLAIRAMFLGT